MSALSVVEKILQKHVVGDSVPRTGEYISLSPLHVMTHDNSFHVIKKFKSMEAPAVASSQQVVFALDHDIQNVGEANLARYAAIEAFAKEHGIDFYPAGRGIGHQVMCEEGYAIPGSMCVASDSHSNMYGGVGCLGTPVVRTDAASIWITGKTWWRVPPICRVELTGELPQQCSGKDVIIALCGTFNKSEVLNCAVEFAGEGIKSLSVDDRLTIANMSTEWGALCGLFPADEITLDWFEKRSKVITHGRPGANPLPSAQQRASRLTEMVAKFRGEGCIAADPGAQYAKRLTLDLSTLNPLIIGPNTLKDSKRPHTERRKIHKAWLLSCVNSRANDIEEAAHVLRGKKIANWVEFYIAAASSEVQAEAERKGDWQVLVDAGAIVLPPGCGACAGLGSGTIGAGEVGIAATNRNFQGRMGHRDAEVYLASPKLVAASALEGFISEGDQRIRYESEEPQIIASMEIPDARAAAKVDSRVTLIPSFPKEIAGDMVFCNANDISTDGIYHGKHMYEDMSPSQMAEVAMENYDPDFLTKLAQCEGPILVSGHNFGTGSSREQAAQCLLYLGIQAVVAASYSATYVRNALNNGLPIFEAPEFVEFLTDKYANERDPTIVTGLRVRLALEQWSVEFGDGQHFPIVPIGSAAQELIASGGLEQWIKAQMSAS